MMPLIMQIFKTEWLSIFKIRAVFSVLIGGIVVYFFFYPIPYQAETVRNAPIVVIDQDRTTTSEELMIRLSAADTIQIISELPTMDEARDYIKNRKAYGIILIPSGFEKKILGGESSPIVYYGDASYVIIYSHLSTGLVNVIRSLSEEIGAERSIAQGTDPAIAKGNSASFKPLIIPLFNPQDGYETYVVPPAYVLIIHQSLLAAIMLASLFNRQNIREIQVKHTKVSATDFALSLVIGRFLAYFLVGLPLFLIYMFFTPIFYDLPFLGSFIENLVIGTLFLSAVILFGIFLGTFIKRMDDVFLLVLPLSMLLFFITGVSWPKEIMPSLFIFLREFFPAVFSVQSLITVNQMGGDLKNIVAPLSHLLMNILLYGVLAVYFVRKIVNKKS